MGAPASASALETSPQVSGWPLVGPVVEVQRDLLGLYERAHRECGDVARLVTGVPPFRKVIHLVMHPDGIRHVLAGHGRDYGKDSPLYQELRAYIGAGLLTSQDQDWERQKRLIQPLFTPRRVSRYAEIMAEESARLVAAWRDGAAAGRPVDLHHGCMTYTLRVVARVLFGSELDDVVEVLERTVEPLQRHIMFRGLVPGRVPRQWPTPGARRAARDQNELYAVVDRLIDRAFTHESDSDRTDLLTLLRGARDPADGSALRRDEVRDQLLVFLLAGHETTANALTFTLYLLGRHSDVQAKVRAEARSGLAHPAEGLPYIRQTVQEAMRLYPPACHIGRDARRDDVLLGHDVRAGDAVLVPVWVVHRDPRWWPDPLRFDPSRFSADRFAEQRKYSYLPFGGGPRACIGARFALLESSILVATVVQTLALSTEPHLPPLYPGITLRPSGPIAARCDLLPE